MTILKWVGFPFRLLLLLAMVPWMIFFATMAGLVFVLFFPKSIGDMKVFFSIMKDAWGWLFNPGANKYGVGA